MSNLCFYMHKLHVLAGRSCHSLGEALVDIVKLAVHKVIELLSDHGITALCLLTGTLAVLAAVFGPRICARPDAHNVLSVGAA